MAKNWYMLHVHSGFEDRVKATLEERIKKYSQQDLFGDIVVPSEQIVEMVKGEKKTSTRKFFPGYMLINMELTDDTWHTVHENMPRVVGFVGDDKDPQPITDKEADKILGRIQDGSEKPRPKVIFDVGEVVRVVDGPFANFEGIVEEVSPEKGRVKVMVSIFGRQTPVELEYIQVINL